eukprot:4541305-Prymnesium_polylepis.1
MRALAHTWPILSPATAGSTRHRQLPSPVAATTGSTPLQGRTAGKTAIKTAPPGFEPPAFGVCSRRLTTRLLGIES